jgi:hypothetical protein
MFHNYNHNIQSIIISLGLTIFNYLGYDKLSEKELLERYSENTSGNILENKLSEEKLKCEQTINENKLFFSEQKKDLTKHYTTIIDELETKIKEQKIEETIKINEKMEYVNSMNKHTIDNYQKQISLLEDRIKTLEVIENKLCDKNEFKNPTEQGDYAEKILDSIVYENLSYDDKARIVDTSDYGGSGDRIINFSNGFRLMIEVKNKDTIKKSDLSEFEEHYNNDFKNNKIDCALFLSYRTPQIPNKCNAIILKYDSQSKDVCYFGIHNNLSPIEKKEKIKQIINEIYEKYKEKIENHKITKTSEENKSDIYNNYLQLLNEDKLFLETKIKENDKNKQQLETKMKENTQKLNKVYQDIQINSISVKKELLNDKLYKSMLRDNIKSWIETNSIDVKQHNWKKIVRKDMNLCDTDSKLIDSIKYNDIKI